MPFALYQQRSLNRSAFNQHQRRKKFLSRTIVYTTLCLCLAISFLVLFIDLGGEFFFILMLIFFLYACYELVFMIVLLCRSKTFHESDTVIIQNNPVQYIEMTSPNHYGSNNFNHIYPANYNYHPKSYGYFDGKNKSNSTFQMNSRMTDLYANNQRFYY